ncbi:MAG: hypothetical protein M3Y65_24800 [Pseudomonadota bacterium]|nr:hypothetical protein [Pseudomonadota bacterium]
MMLRKIAMLVPTLCIVACFTGCATTGQAPATVFIPVIAPKSALPARPILSIATLTPASAPDQVVKAYAESVLQLTGYATSLEELLNAK